MLNSNIIIIYIIITITLLILLLFLSLITIIGFVTCKYRCPCNVSFTMHAGLARSWHENWPQRANRFSGRSSTWPKTAVALAPLPPTTRKTNFNKDLKQLWLAVGTTRCSVWNNYRYCSSGFPWNMYIIKTWDICLKKVRKYIYHCVIIKMWVWNLKVVIPSFMLYVIEHQTNII